MRGGRVAFKELLHVFVNQAVMGQFRLEIGELLQIRQMPIDEQVADLDEIGPNHLFDRISAIQENAFLAVDKGNLTLARAGVAVAVVHGDGAGVRPQLGDVDGYFSNRSIHQGKFGFFSIDCELRGSHSCLTPVLVRGEVQGRSTSSPRSPTCRATEKAEPKVPSRTAF